MKKLLLSCSLALIIFPTFGQLDLALDQIIHPVNGTSGIIDGQLLASVFVVKNEGSTTLNINDTIYFRNELNGQTQIYSSSGVNFNTFSYVLSKIFAPNDTVHIAVTLPVQLTANGVPPATSFTWGFNVRGTTCCPTVDDNDPSNDVLFVTLNNSGMGTEELLSDKPSIRLADDILYVNTPPSQSASAVEIYNLIGQKVMVMPLRSTEAVYDVSALKHGIYIAVLKDSDKVISSKKILK